MSQVASQPFPKAAAGAGRTRRRLLGGLVALGLAGTAPVLLHLKGASTEKAEPPRPRPVPAVAAWGRLIPSSEVIELVPSSTMDGVRIERLLVEEGDEIRAGQVLAVLDLASRRELAVAEAKARLALAEARVAQTGFGPKPEDVRAQEALIRRNEVEFAKAEREYERTRTLADQRAATREESENRKSTLDAVRLALEQARAQLESLKRVREVDLAVAKAERDQAAAALAISEADRDHSRVVSPLEGRVLKIRARAGQRVAVDRGVMAIGDTRVMHVIAEVFEQDVPRVRVGAEATVRVSSLELTLKGVVLRAGQMIERKDIFGNDPVADVDSRVTEVRIALSAEDSRRVERLTNARVEVRIEPGPRSEAWR